MNKIVLGVLALLVLPLGINAQGFSKFRVEGAVTETRIKVAKNGPSIVEVIVNEQVDLKNVQFDYKLYSNCEISPALTPDFTQRQKVTINKQGEQKEWVVAVKKLVPASLPLELNFTAADPAVWNAQTKGWATYGTDESKGSVVRFGNAEVFFIAAVNSDAKEVSFNLSLVGKSPQFDGSFELTASADNKTWKRVKGFKSKNITNDSNFTCELPEGTRFIKWEYAERAPKQNVNLNNIVIK